MSDPRRRWPQVRREASDYRVDSPPSPSHLPSHELLPHPRGRPHGRHRLPARRSRGGTRGDLHHFVGLRRGHEAEPALHERRRRDRRDGRRWRQHGPHLRRPRGRRGRDLRPLLGPQAGQVLPRGPRRRRRPGDRRPPCRSARTARCTWCAPATSSCSSASPSTASSPIRTYTEEEARAAGLLPRGRRRGRRRRRPGDPNARRLGKPACADDHRRGAGAHPPGHGARVIARPRRPTARTPSSSCSSSAASRWCRRCCSRVTGFTRILDRPGLHPHGPGHADRAAEPGARRHRAVPDDLRDGADLHGGQRRRHRAAAGRSRSPRPQAIKRAPEAAARVHVQARRERSDLALFVKLAQDRAAEDPRGRPDLRPDPGLHHLRAQDGVPDRLPDLPAVPRDRPRRQLHAHVAWA